MSRWTLAMSVIAVEAAASMRMAVPGTAAHDIQVVSRIANAARVHLRWQVPYVAISIQRPFENVAVHVVKTPGVGGLFAHLMGTAEAGVLRPYLFVRQTGFFCGTSTAGVFPFGLGGQTVFITGRHTTRFLFSFGQSLAKPHGIHPADPVDRQIGRALDPAGIVTHELFPDRKRQLELPDPESFREANLDIVVGWIFRITSPDRKSTRLNSS